MPRYSFSFGTATDVVRQAGVVQSESFSDALETISEHLTAKSGDTLEIGVQGFPPARYEYVWTLEKGIDSWRPAGLLAA